ncbi:MAG: polysaccharide biosynthesis/export family protein [Candidatus Omnitrophota bacterium]|jgi:polysaccharide export outer membrane protein
MKIAISLFALALITAVLPLSAHAEKSQYKLQPLDVISITVHQQPDLSTKTRVAADGSISFPLIGKIASAGLTVQELEQKIKGLLEKDYLVKAEVLVFIEEYRARQVSVTGEVNNAGKFNIPIEREITLLEAVAMAGGFTKDADINRTKVLREENGEKKAITIRVKDITDKDQKDENIVLRPDDIIVVPKRFFFSVMGEVKSPGKFDMPTERSVTLLESIAMAGGFTKDADLGKVKVMRVEDNEKKTIFINIKDITEKDQKDKDIPLEADDIVFVPESFF